MKRYGSIIGLKTDMLEKYKQYHADIWPEISNRILKCNIRNYSIYYNNGLLFSYFEYIGTDFEKDMEEMARDPKTQEWWDIMKPMQIPLQNRAEGEWWADMEEVFHLD